MTVTATAGGTAGAPVVPAGFCYGQEDGCDIIFLAGRGHDTWRLPAHKFLLTQSTPVFTAMLSPPFLPADAQQPHTIKITDVDGKAMDNLLRFLYTEPVTLQSVDTALLTLQVADKYICPGLARVCISFLTDNLGHANALSILKFIRLYCGESQNLENLAKERGIADITRHANGTINGGTVSGVNCLEAATKLAESDVMMNSESIPELCTQLLIKCLLVVDSHSEAILGSEELEDLDIFTVRLILERNTLNLTNEMLVFQALMRWADKECKRSQLPLTPSSKRQVLGDEAVFLPRYLVMSPSDFLANGGPAQSGIFTKEELKSLLRLLKDISSMSGAADGKLQFDKVLEVLKKNDPRTIPQTLRPHLLTIAYPRRSVSPLSNNSSPRNSPKKKRPTLWERWLCMKSCSKYPSSPAHSNHSSPIRTCSRNRSNSRNNASPLRCAPPPRSGPSTLDVAIERLIICWAFFFD